MNDFAMMIDQQQVTHTHVAKAQTEWIDPKVISEFGVAHGDVASDSFAKAHSSKDAQRSSKARFAVSPLFFDVVEGRHRQKIGIAAQGCFS
jgi:hypothetical protein